MLPTDKPAFGIAIRKLMGVFNRHPDDEQVEIWWAVLKRIHLDDVRAAFLRWSSERNHAPTPANIRETCAAMAPAQHRAPVEDKFWTRTDLVCACNFADPSLVFRTAEMPWAARVVRSYDAGLADTCERVLARFPGLAAADAARAHLSEHPGWKQPKNNSVPM